MSTTSTPPAPAEPSRQQESAPPRVPGRRRRWVWITSGVLIAAAVAGNAALVAHLADRAPVLVLARDVAWGQPITPDDVVARDLPAEVGAFAVPDTARSGFIGQVAAANLRTGDLLSQRDVSAQAVPGPGQRVLGLRLDPGHYPAGGLTPNDPIAVHPAPDDTTASTTQATDGQEFLARVVRTSLPDAEGAITADVLIPETTSTAAVEAAVGGAQVSLLGPAR
ncbi:SAF domain-containing protein [Saccharopolyspora sp. 6V]|uniref:SAF domain-containing protein n=1 Tax=Saccharopolyspora sp. 6V TaxID=2877239 RepID=UPI001CD355CA|nr:SAF domain-containing protein [Saccharopolyspora sp. 6V]MCA1192884.1 SAF domain-containing protein [Saccharopolyspora sp. 6V]